jgi:hypothetical protein
MHKISFLLLVVISFKSFSATAQDQWRWDVMEQGISYFIPGVKYSKGQLFVKSQSIPITYTSQVKVNDSTYIFEGLNYIGILKVITNKPEYLIEGDLIVRQEINGIKLIVKDGSYAPYKKNRYAVMEPSKRDKKSFEGLFNSKKRGKKASERYRVQINSAFQPTIDHLRNQSMN